MKKAKKIMYDNMYVFEFNGFALMALITLILYGAVSVFVDFINLL